jgi:hypothetical protein
MIHASRIILEDGTKVRMFKDLWNIVIEFSPYLFPVVDFLILLITGDLHALAGVFGNILNILLNWSLRRILGNFFPDSGWIFPPNTEDKGKCRLDEVRFVKSNEVIIEMPSLHAQQVAYYSTYWLLVLAYNLEGNLDAVRRITALILLEVFSFMVCYVRYTSSYSSLAQLIVGYVIGVIFAMGWYFLLKYLVAVSSNNTVSF